MLWLLLSAAVFAGDCDNEFRKATESGPLDPEQLRYRLKCEEKGGEEKEEFPFICVIAAMPKAEERRHYGFVPLTAMYSPGKSYGDMVGVWHPHSARYKNNKSEVTDVTVSANNNGVKVIKRKRQTVERIQLSLLETTLSYEKTAGNKAPERREFSCSEYSDKPEAEEPPKRVNRWGKRKTGIAEPGKPDAEKKGTGPNKSGISGSY